MNNNKLFPINKLICGDNLEVLATFEDESVDLIYIDPPFFSNRNYEVVWGDEAEIRSFKDRWAGGVEHYIAWMEERVREMNRILKSTGSMYLHCDWHAGHYLKVMMDKIFGANNFRNEIIWHYRTGGVSKKWFGRKHDTIFFYTKSNEWTFNPQEVKEYYEGKPSLQDRKSGRDDGGYYHWVYAPDVWEIPAVFNLAREFLGYPTQKPEALLERIIKASSTKDDLILDAFAGCGTALVAAQKLGRRWIGIDISTTAIRVMEQRLKKLGAMDIVITGMPQGVKHLKKLESFEFQNWVINEMGAHHSRVKVGDMGIDGYFPESLFRQPAVIQVKQSENIGRNVVDNFETAMRRAKKQLGFIVAFSFSKGAYEEAARVKNKEGLTIKLISVDELLRKKQKALY